MLAALPFTGYGFEGETVSCPVCGGSDHRTVAGLDRRLKRLKTALCGHCGTLYTNPMPREDELADYYARHYRRDYQRAATGPSARHRRKRLAEAEARIAKVPDVYATARRSLDFGCGSGELVETLLERGLDAHGFDPGESYADTARSRLAERVQARRWQDAAYDAPFDLVTCFHVLEHLRDPVGALAKMASLLAPDGRLVVEVPDMENDARKGIGGLHLAHVVGFNGANLELAAARAGLVLEQAYEPTGFVLRHGTPGDIAALAARGLEKARTGYVDREPVTTYLGYQLGKLTGRAS